MTCKKHTADSDEANEIWNILVMKGKSFDFLHKEKDLYSKNDK